MVPQLSPTAWEALDELYQAKLEGSGPVPMTEELSTELQQKGLAVELPDGTVEITLAGSETWEERKRLQNT